MDVTVNNKEKRVGCTDHALLDLRAVAAIGVVAGDPFIGDDGGGEGEFAAEHGGSDDFGQFTGFTIAVAVHCLKAFALGGQACAAAIAGDDQ